MYYLRLLPFLFIGFSALLPAAPATVGLTTPPGEIRPAVYKDGLTAVDKIILEHATYPEAAREMCVEGEVIVSFFILPDGQLHKPRIVKGIGYGCDAEVLRVLNELPSNWQPATLDGRPVGSKIRIVVNFRLL